MPLSLAVEGDGATTSALLAEAVDAALALLVAGRVPGQVVVDDGVEVVLQVDALGQAVGGDQDPAGGRVVASDLGELLDAVDALLRGERAGDARATTVLRPSLPSRCSATYSAVGMKRQKTIGW